MSIFNMDQVNQVVSMDYNEAVEFIHDIIDKDEVARPVTKSKAKIAISKCKTPGSLAMTMSGWILAHPDEGLKVI